MRQDTLVAADDLHRAKLARSVWNRWRRSAAAAELSRSHDAKLKRVVFGHWYVRSAVIAKQRAVLRRIRNGPGADEGGLNQSQDLHPYRQRSVVTVLPARSLPQPVSVHSLASVGSEHSH
jgi:hypothetical protein